MLLKYDIAVVGIGTVDRALSGIERRFVQHNARVNRASGGRAPRKGAARRESRVAGDAMLREQQRTDARRVGQEAKTLAKIRALRGRARRRTEREAFRSAQREAKLTARARERFSRGVGRAGARSVGGAVGAVGRVGMGLLAVGGGFALAGALESNKQRNAKARALANQAFATPGTEGVSRDALKARALAVAEPEAIASGRGVGTVLDAMRSFVSIAGNFPAAEKITPFLTELADATDSDLGDVGRTAGQIFQGVFAATNDANKAFEATRDIMSGMAGQAKIGSIEMKDLATQMGKLISSTSAFDGDVVGLAKTMGAVGQLAIAGGASSPEEAMTALMNFSADVAKKGGGRAFMKHGINPFTDDAKTTLRNPAEVIMESIEKTGGSLPELGKMFGRRGMKAVSPFRKKFVEAGGGAAGLKAMRDAFDRFTKQVLSDVERQESAAARRTELDRKTERLSERFNLKIGPAMADMMMRLLPEFEKLIPHVQKAAEVLADVVAAFAKNPMAGIGILIAGLVAKDIAAAGIGMLMRAAFAKMMVAAGIAPAATGAAAGGAGLLGAAKTAATAVAGTGLLPAAGTAAALVGLAGAVVINANEQSDKLDEFFNPPKAPSLLDAMRKTAGGGDPAFAGGAVSDVLAGVPAQAAKGGGQSVKLEGVGDFKEAVGGMMSLPADIKAALAAGQQAASSPNRSNSPTVPRVSGL